MEILFSIFSWALTILLYIGLFGMLIRPIIWIHESSGVSKKMNEPKEINVKIIIIHQD